MQGARRGVAQAQVTLGREPLVFYRAPKTRIIPLTEIHAGEHLHAGATGRHP